MKPLLIAAALVLIATPAVAQQAPPVVIPIRAPDEAGTARYVADFTRLCLDTGGEREAVRTAAVAAGWTPGTPPGASPNATDMAAWDAPDGGAKLMTSASPQGDMDDGLTVRTCILQPAPGSAPSRADLTPPIQAAVGHAPRLTVQGPVWVVSGTRADGFADESAIFAVAGSTEEGFKLALQRPLLLVNLVGGRDQAAAVVLRLSVE